MYRSRARLRLGMPHTQSGGISETALLIYCAHLRWTDIGDVTGIPASRQRDADGHRVYASVYFVDLDGFPPAGLGALHPDDDIEVASTLVRFGHSMLDGEHRLYPAGTLPEPLPEVLPSAPCVRLSNVFVRERGGPDDLRITTPSGNRLENLAQSEHEPDSYQLIRVARQHGRFADPPADAVPLPTGSEPVVLPINPDRDVNGVGLIYFANYVAYMDLAERMLLEAHAGFEPHVLDDRRTLRRRIGFYGNAQRHDSVRIEVDAYRLPGTASRLLLNHRVMRQADGRLIAVSSCEKLLAEETDPGS
jgi:probable biosynthetic protein (TIGR04098 family)